MWLPPLPVVSLLVILPSLVVPPTVHPTSSCSQGWSWVVRRLGFPRLVSPLCSFRAPVPPSPPHCFIPSPFPLPSPCLPALPIASFRLCFPSPPLVSLLSPLVSLPSCSPPSSSPHFIPPVVSCSPPPSVARTPYTPREQSLTTVVGGAGCRWVIGGGSGCWGRGL